MIETERVKRLNGHAVQNRRYVLYWMQAAQRVHGNHALVFAAQKARQRKKPLLVFFGLTADFPEANARHYAFMLQGLAEVQRELKARGVPLVIRVASPEKEAWRLAGHADLVVTDRGYLRIQKAWRQALASNIDCPLFQVETEVIVPVEAAYPKEAYTAGVLRPKLQKQLPGYLTPLESVELPSSALQLESLLLGDIDVVLKRLNIDSSVPAAPGLEGGYARARQKLDSFLDHHLDRYPDDKNDPSKIAVSGLSPYLHFGQISSLEIALAVLERHSPGEETFLDELIVRRELSCNFVHYNAAYDTFACLPDWAQNTLREHQLDAREAVYSREDFENARTHDPYWNAAQTEMVETGIMHGYMRMYWGKKILEWSPDAETGFQTALYLNNKYAVDGRDPNSFAGVAWCFGKHDRAWNRRPVFGKVRSMTAGGLERKFDIQAYVKRVTGTR